MISIKFDQNLFSYISSIDKVNETDLLTNINEIESHREYESLASSIYPASNLMKYILDIKKESLVRVRNSYEMIMKIDDIYNLRHQSLMNSMYECFSPETMNIICTIQLNSLSQLQIYHLMFSLYPIEIYPQTKLISKLHNQLLDKWNIDREYVIAERLYMYDLIISHFDRTLMFVLLRKRILHNELDYTYFRHIIHNTVYNYDSIFNIRIDAQNREQLFTRFLQDYQFAQSGLSSIQKILAIFSLIDKTDSNLYYPIISELPILFNRIVHDSARYSYFTSSLAVEILIIGIRSRLAHIFHSIYVRNAILHMQDRCRLSHSYVESIFDRLPIEIMNSIFSSCSISNSSRSLISICHHIDEILTKLRVESLPEDAISHIDEYLIYPNNDIRTLAMTKFIRSPLPRAISHKLYLITQSNLQLIHRFIRIFLRSIHNLNINILH